jgi:putative inorganic carbon (HCO3(-)) transporter
MPLNLGNSYVDASQIEQYLAVDRSNDGSAVRGFGTLASPGSTVRLCMMIIPFALFLSVRNPMFKVRLGFAAATIFGLLGLVLTFTRVYFITTAIQVALAFMMMVRDGALKRAEVVAAVMLGLAAVAAVSPKLYQQFTVREDSVSVRFQQYEAAARMILLHPFLGVGLNNGTGQKAKYTNVTYNPYDPDTQFYLEPTHNLYLSMASEIGVPGTLCFVAFFGRIIYLAWSAWRKAKDREVRLIGGILVVAYCGVAVNSLMDPLPEYPVLVLLWLYAGLALNLPRMAGTAGSADDGLARAGATYMAG